MKLKRTFLIALGTILIGILFSAFTANEKSVIYDYASLIQDEYGFYVTIGTESYEKIDLKEKPSSAYDFRPLFKKVNEFQEKGWEVLFENTYTHGNGYKPNCHVLMRKKRE